MENPYEAPGSVVSDEPVGVKRHRVGLSLFLYAAPLLGVGVMVVFLMRAFSGLADDGHADPSELAGEVSMAMVVILPFLLMGLFGYAKMFYVIFRDGHRGRRFFWGAITLSALYCFLAFPVGLLGGGILIGVLLAKRKEFFSSVPED